MGWDVNVIIGSLIVVVIQDIVYYVYKFGDLICYGNYFVQFFYYFWSCEFFCNMKGIFEVFSGVYVLVVGLLYSIICDISSYVNEIWLLF